MKSLKTVFNVVALAVGGTLTSCSGLGLATGGFDSSNQMAGVNLNFIGVIMLAAGVGLFYAGYRGMKNMAKEEAQQNKNDQNPKPPAP